ncbi:MAG: hypothetical protein ABIQ08_05110 [Duganella sp.]
MKKNRFFCMAAIFLLITGCTINSVKPLPPGDVPDKSRAVIVYGVKVEGSWQYDGFTVELAEYDIGMQNITGDCFHFNRADASVATAPGEVKYFASTSLPAITFIARSMGPRLRTIFLHSKPRLDRPYTWGISSLRKTGRWRLSEALMMLKVTSAPPSRG